MGTGADLVSWAFRSPGRLAVIAVVVIGGLLALGNLWHTPVQQAPAAASATATASPTATVTAEVPDAQPFVATAVHFVQQWARLRPGETAAQWQKRLAPLTTDDLAAALKLTDTATLPDATPSGEPVVRFVAADSALVAVPLSGGTAVLVTVVRGADGDNWLVSDIQPDEGDSGGQP